MFSPDSRPSRTIPSAAPTARAPETFRAKSIATRLTESEFAEVEAAAAREGKKCAEWLRDAALAHARDIQGAATDPILLAELMGIRALIQNLFAASSKGPLSEESLRKISAYAESIKQQKADELLAELRENTDARTHKKQR